jgi:hypothetical protein
VTIIAGGSGMPDSGLKGPALCITVPVSESAVCGLITWRDKLAEGIDIPMTIGRSQGERSPSSLRDGGISP